MSALRIHEELRPLERESARFRAAANAADRKAGFATPEGSGLEVQTALSALEAAVAMKDWTCVFDALAYLRERGRNGN